MARPWPVPPGDKTIHAIGDVHIGAVFGGAFGSISAISRANRLAADINGSTLLPNPAARIQIGDFTEQASQSSHAPAANAWATSISNNTTFYGVIGNHDISDYHSEDATLPDELFRDGVSAHNVFTSWTGSRTPNWVKDLGFIRMIGVSIYGGPHTAGHRGRWAAGTAYNANDVVTLYNAPVAPSTMYTVKGYYRRLISGTTATSPDVDTVNWESWAVAPNPYLTLNPVAQQYLADQLEIADNDGQDCVIFCHGPPENTVTSPDGEPTNNYYSSKNPGGDGGMRCQDPDDIRGIVSVSPRAKMWVSGHTHSIPEAPGFIKASHDMGFRSITTLNLGAVAYNGTAKAAHPLLADPINSFYLTFPGDNTVEIRMRSHSYRTWAPVNGQMVTKITFNA